MLAGVYQRMKRKFVTIILLIIVAAILTLRSDHRTLRPSQYGIQTVLVHNCSYEESFRELGDDRQIIVTNHADGSISINETPFTSSTVGPELAKIFQYRSLKLVWFIGDPQLTYGQAMKTLSDLHAEGSNFVVALPTTSQTATANLSRTQIVFQCPYGL